VRAVTGLGCLRVARTAGEDKERQRFIVLDNDPVAEFCHDRKIVIGRNVDQRHRRIAETRVAGNERRLAGEPADVHDRAIAFVGCGKNVGQSLAHAFRDPRRAKGTSAIFG
jgi:hypothetical protein